MTNDNTPLFRIEIKRPSGKIDCYQCLRMEQFGEVIAPIAVQGEKAKGTWIHIYDYQSWQPGLKNDPLITFQAA